MKEAESISSFTQSLDCDSRVKVEPGMDGVKVQFKGSCDGTESCIEFLQSFPMSKDPLGMLLSELH